LIIREVWEDNLEEEFSLIREIVDDYPYIAMDTEFPGTVVRSVSNFKTPSELSYYNIKCNVDILHLIQLGLTFSNQDGKLPSCGTDKDKYCIWQFNFREFNPDKDIHPIKIYMPLILLSFCSRVVLISRKTMRRESMHNDSGSC
jgi:CCR4-NOT transcription complex subunit 7/8